MTHIFRLNTLWGIACREGLSAEDQLVSSQVKEHIVSVFGEFISEQELEKAASKQSAKRRKGASPKASRKHEKAAPQKKKQKDKEKDKNKEKTEAKKKKGAILRDEGEKRIEELCKDVSQEGMRVLRSTQNKFFSCSKRDLDALEKLVNARSMGRVRDFIHNLTSCLRSRRKSLKKSKADAEVKAVKRMWNVWLIEAMKSCVKDAQVQFQDNKAEDDAEESDDQRENSSDESEVNEQIQKQNIKKKTAAEMKKKKAEERRCKATEMRAKRAAEKEKKNATKTKAESKRAKAAQVKAAEESKIKAEGGITGKPYRGNAEEKRKKTSEQNAENAELTVAEEESRRRQAAAEKVKLTVGWFLICPRA